MFTVDLDLLIALRLRSRRRLLGLTLQQVADLCGTSFQTIHKYETGKVSLSVRRLWELSQVLDVEPNYFFSGLADRQPTPLRRVV